MYHRVAYKKKKKQLGRVKKKPRGGLTVVKKTNLVKKKSRKCVKSIRKLKPIELSKEVTTVLGRMKKYSEHGKQFSTQLTKGNNVKFLGGGAFGKVIGTRYQDLRHGHYCVKEVDFGDFEATPAFTRTSMEVAVPAFLKDCYVENVVKMKDIIHPPKEFNSCEYNDCDCQTSDDCESNERLYVVYEKGQTNLLDYMEKQSAGVLRMQMKSIIYQMIRGVHELHSLGIYHLDIKPSNFVVSLKDDGDVEVKLIDFGLCCSADYPYDSEREHGYLQTLWYRCPELLLREEYWELIFSGMKNGDEEEEDDSDLLLGKRHGTLVTEKCDVFSLGLVIMEMLCGYPMFSMPNACEQVEAIVQFFIKGENREEFLEAWAEEYNVPTDLVELIDEMIAFFPYYRSSTRECLRSAYLRDMCAKPEHLEWERRNKSENEGKRFTLDVDDEELFGSRESSVKFLHSLALKYSSAAVKKKKPKKEEEEEEEDQSIESTVSWQEQESGSESKRRSKVSEKETV